MGWVKYAINLTILLLDIQHHQLIQTISAQNAFDGWHMVFTSHLIINICILACKSSAP